MPNKNHCRRCGRFTYNRPAICWYCVGRLIKRLFRLD